MGEDVANGIRPGARPAARAVAVGALAALLCGAAPLPAGDPPATADGTPPEGLIPRDALVDTSRVRALSLCASEAYLGCMGIDGSRCRALSEAAIAQCLLPLPEAVDPTTLDGATLESCPRRVYERAGFDESTARACRERAFDES